MKWISGGVTAPQGFKAAGINAGIKKTRKDMALIVSDIPGTIAGTFTTNQVKAAPVQLDLQNIKSGKGQAFIVNSGNANACTGKAGLTDARLTTAEVGKVLHIDPKLVYVCSTGVIGQRLPMQKIFDGIHIAAKGLSVEGGADAAHAIMTTDRIPKEVAVEFTLGGKTCRLGGITKGAGMIAPNMTPSGLHATMLCFLTTDAAVSKDVLKSVLADAVQNSFNCVTVDNDCSTNDTVLLLANGLAGNKTLTKSSKKDLAIFQEAVQEVCLKLAKLIAKDGEGATKLIEVLVNQGKSAKEARQIAMTVANSPLVKTAIFGTDANWGRILCAVGYSGIPIHPEKIAIILGGKKENEKSYKKVVLVKNGISSGYDESKAKEILSNPEILVEINLHQGKSSTTIWTCDFSLDYVKINASYRS